MLEVAVPEILQFWRDPDTYTMAHPTGPDSVLNYDSEERIVYPVVADFKEPDCSPHPFDIMAIEALYQTVVDP